MKIRDGFVSNSSSTSFTILNTTDKAKTLVDFVRENSKLIKEYNKRYDWKNYKLADLIEDAKSDRYATKFAPNQSKVLVFGDEQGTAIGNVYDYILREGGFSRSFAWQYHGSRR